MSFQEPDAERPRILLTGATGYIGGRLLTRLEADGGHIRCLARRPENLAGKVADSTEVVRGDLNDRDSLDQAMCEIDVAYYLVHSLGSSGDFEAEEAASAQNFADAARNAGVGRIIYLGGLGGDAASASSHLRSRRRVGEILRTSRAAVIEFRASIVIGSGSVSFEMVRALVERLPVMITPRWVSVPAQPIAINDLIEYLASALKVEGDDNRVFEIGGSDVVSYGGLMREYARQRRLRRMMIAVPVLTPRLSSLWLGLVTPVYARIGRKLIDSLRNASVVDAPPPAGTFDIQPAGVQDAIAAAIHNEDREFAETRWSDALSSSGAQRQNRTVRFGSRLVDTRTVVVPAPPQSAFSPISKIGGDTGWYCANYLWSIRGFLDLLTGGVGVRRGRRDPDRLAVGDTVDWWRVESYEPGRRVKLFAEMRMPGRAWLEFEVSPHDQGSLIRQTAEFDPVGLAGLIYWYSLWPLHSYVFRGMIRGIAAAAVRDARNRN
ncbi:MAG: SDR family oxidoreductase [Chloroflexi bacterium]|nr:SDR family oxidoreductase [Chloroflexota bacterium]